MQCVRKLKFVKSCVYFCCSEFKVLQNSCKSMYSSNVGLQMLDISKAQLGSACIYIIIDLGSALIIGVNIQNAMC